MSIRKIAKSSNTKAKVIPKLPHTENDDDDSFDKEVLWCILQMEKLMASGKISDAKSKFSKI